MNKLVKTTCIAGLFAATAYGASTPNLAASSNSAPQQTSYLAPKLPFHFQSIFLIWGGPATPYMRREFEGEYREISEKEIEDVTKPLKEKRHKIALNPALNKQ